MAKITIHVDLQAMAQRIDTHGQRFIVQVPGQPPRATESKSSKAPPKP